MNIDDFTVGFIGGAFSVVGGYYFVSWLGMEPCLPVIGLGAFIGALVTRKRV